MNVEQLVELELAGKPKQSETARPHSNIVHHESNIIRPGIEPGLPGWEAGYISNNIITLLTKLPRNIQAYRL
jgi:hypothetical protein